ncbi:DUF1471 domain-containing protein [Enterobacter sp.]|uniref:DUF1471 domain-containing protein n=1 Tax=Enterobacter sp. TaxID=42895 RepID=UPI003D0B9584
MKSISMFLSVTFSILFSTAAFSADLPEKVNADASAHLTRIGVVSISSFNGSTDDVVAALQQKAVKLGASKLRIVSLGNPGDSALWYGNAEAYK